MTPRSRPGVTRAIADTGDNLTVGRTSRFVAILSPVMAGACAALYGVTDVPNAQDAGTDGSDAVGSSSGVSSVGGDAQIADGERAAEEDGELLPDVSCGSLDTVANCGACGRACDTTQSVGAACVAGKCTYTGCQAGWVDCDQTTSDGNTNGCESSLTSTATCGGCGKTCDTTNSLGASCEPADGGGVTCAYTGCAPGYADCDPAAPNTDGCETSLTTASNCGACGIACDSTNSLGATCLDGKTCNYTGCKSGFADCVTTAPDTDGCEATVAPNSCAVCGGACDTTHSNGETCDVSDAGGGATCKYTSCASGYANCNTTPPDVNGCETSITTASNCGACGQACDTKTSTGASCSSGGSCAYGPCVSGWADCTTTAPDTNGCETSLTSTSSCGGCKNACNTATGTAKCNGTTCSYACNTGRSDCNAATAPDVDGCECATPMCCGTKCQTVHTNGVGQNFYDCVATGTYNVSQANEACAAFGAATCTSGQAAGLCPFGPVKSVCGASGSKCYCWQYSGHKVGTVQSESTSSCKPSCGANGDPAWN
jgi:hypothetical protein